ncbi:hypothetical protein BGW38_001306, partial [Lunasporangiospora selenospora]
RSLSIFLVIIDAFPHSTIVQELIRISAAFLGGTIAIQSVPGDSLKIRVPKPRVINVIFFYLLFGPFLLDLPSVISSGTFLSRGEYTKTNIAIAVHFITLGGVLMFATGIFYFTLNQLANAIAEYTVPSEMTLVQVGVSPVTLDGVDGQMLALSPITERDMEETVDSSLAKARHRLINIRNIGTAMLCFYVMIYLLYGIVRPLIHSHIFWNVFFCVCFNLDPGTPTIFAYFIVSILYHIRQSPQPLCTSHPTELSSGPLPRPPMARISSFRRARPRSDSYLFEHHFSMGPNGSLDDDLHGGPKWLSKLNHIPATRSLDLADHETKVASTSSEPEDSSSCTSPVLEELTPPHVRLSGNTLRTNSSHF